MKHFYLFLFVFLISKYSSPNVIGTDMQNFNPTTSGLNFVTVQSSETLEPGILNFGLFFNYAVNSLPYYVEDETNSRIAFNDTLFMADINLGIGIMKNWDFGLSLPHLLRQKIDNDRFHLQFENSGMLEVRLNTKYKFWTFENHGMAFIVSVNFNRIENNPFTGSDPGPTFNIELAYDTSYREWSLGTNIGYRKRNSGDPVRSAVNSTVIIEPFKDQFLASLGASYLIKKYDTKIISEIFSSFPAKKVTYQPNRSQVSAELLLGLKHDLREDISIHAGGGTKIIHGNASPDWRVYTGINYSFGPLYSKVSSIRRIGEPIENEENFVIEGLLFKFNSDVLKPVAKQLLEELTDYLKKLKSYKIIIVEGHTDSVGNANYNFALSTRRANRVKEYLQKVFNIKPQKLKAIGYGETRPIGNNGNYQGRKKNRRVQFKVLK